MPKDQKLQQKSNEPEFDSFTFDEGFETVYDGEIIDAYFEVDNNYKEDALLMHWHIRDLETGEEKQHPIKLSCGDGWYTDDEGKIASHKTKKVFNKSSIYGIACYRCMTELDMLDVLEARFDRHGLGFREAKGWIGLKFHFEPVELKYEGLGEKANKAKVMPVEFLGEATPKRRVTKASPPKASASEKAPEKAAGKKSVQAAEVLAKAKAKKLEAKLKEMAVEAGDFETFLESVMEMEEVTGNEDLLARLADPDGFWAEVMGEAEDEEQE